MAQAYNIFPVSACPGVVQEVFQESLRLADERLSAAVAEASGFFEAIRPQLSGGKRLRPLVLFMCAYGEQGPPLPLAAQLAASVELVHLASLMHDDVIDEAEERRGLRSVPAVVGARRAVLAGDFLAAAAYREIALADLPEAGTLLSEAVVQMTLSEVSGSLKAGQLMAEAEYLELISGKTAALFGAAAEMGALSTHAGERQLAGFRSYGQALGMAFQLRDDLLDLYGDADRLGKGVYRDLAGGLYTLPIIYAAQGPGGAAIKQRLSQLQAAGQSDSLAAEIAGMARDLGGEEHAVAVMGGFVEAACEAVPDCAAKPWLLDLARYVAARGN